MLFEIADLRCKSPGQRNVICIHAGDEAAFTLRYPEVQCAHEPASRFGMNDKASIIARQRLQQFARLIGATIVDDQKLEILVRLREDRRHRLDDKWLPVVDR